MTEIKCPKCGGTMDFFIRKKPHFLPMPKDARTGWHCRSCGHYQRVMLKEQRFEEARLA